MKKPKVAPIAEEFDGVDLGDQRRDRRVVRVAEALSVDPSASLPVASGDDASLEATYRLLRNPKISAATVLAPHVRCTVGRCAAAKSVVIAYDTTQVNFGPTARGDLGHVGQGKSAGFYAHVALAVDAGESREPLGVLAVQVHTRTGDKGRRGHKSLQTAEDNESARWPQTVDKVQEALGKAVSAVHVMDREADSYALMALLVEEEARFVIRMAQATRDLADGAGKVFDALAGAAILATRDVPISTRRPNRMPSYRKHFPPRNARIATLSIRATTVCLARPVSSNRSPSKTLTLNIVHVIEAAPPEGEQPIEWRLWTTEPIETEEQVLAVVDAYRCRWRIEEFFKALKTGCALEKRQLESMHSLKNLLAILCPIAWRLLRLRTLANADGQPASRVLNPIQLKCLAGALAKLKRAPLPAKPTVRDAMLGVAGLGGHIKNNGDPGWQVLGRGLDKLLNIEIGFVLALEAAKL